MSNVSGKCGAGEESSAHILCECEALAPLRHIHLGSSFWTQKILGYWGRGPSRTLSKDRDLITGYGTGSTEGLLIRPGCIGLGEGPYPHFCSILFYSVLFPLL